MIHIRFLIAVLIVPLATSLSLAQTPAMIEPSVAIPLEVTNDTVSVLETGTKLSPLDQPEIIAETSSPVQSAPIIDAAGEPVKQVLNSNAVTTTNRPLSNSQVYSPQRDGLPTLEQRRQLRAMPITERPNRRFHFYGNAVRRRTGR